MKQVLFTLAAAFAILSSCSENKQKSKVTEQINATDNPDSLTGKNAYVNPVDNKTYKTEGEFKEYHPDELKKYEGPVQPLNIVLLTDQNKIALMIPIDTLAEFIKGADAIVMKQLSSAKEKGQLVVQFTLFANKKAKIGMSYKGDLKTKDLTAVSNKLEGYATTIRTKFDSCVYQSIYGINEQKE